MEFYGEIVKVIVALICALITYYVIPYMKAKTTKAQREDAMFWAKLAVTLAESIYKEHGQGALKKEMVLKRLADLNIKMTESQLDTLIEAVVNEFNRNGWSLNGQV